MAIIPIQLKNNIYGQLFAPIIGAYNDTQRTKPDPWEVYVASLLLSGYLETWGGPTPTIDARGVWPTTIPGPEVRYAQTIVDLSKGGEPQARAALNSSRIKKLIKDLDGLRTDQANAWQDYNFALDLFYNTCSISLMYFTYGYKGGQKADFFEESLGLFNHPDGYRSGVEMGTDINGSDGPSPAVTDIVVDTVIPVTDDATYFITYPTPTTQVVYWFEVDFSGTGAPAIPAPPVGTTQQFVKLDISSFDPPADSATNLINQILIAPSYAWGSVVATGASTIRFTTAATGSFPASDLTGLPAHGLWLTSSFTDGDLDPASSFRRDCWMVWCAPAEVLSDRWAMIYDTLGASWLFYYDLDASGTFVPPAGVVPDNTVMISVTTGQTVEDVAVATAAALDSTGFVTTSISTGRYGRQTLIDITYTIAAPVNDFDPGTLTFGNNYVYNDELKASDDTVLATGIDGPEAYATAWNEFRVSYEATLNRRYPYINPELPWIGSTSKVGGVPCGNCRGQEGKCWTGSESGCDLCQSCDYRPTNSVFRTSPYPIYNLPYNTPGHIFDPRTDFNGPVINVGGL